MSQALLLVRVLAVSCVVPLVGAGFLVGEAVFFGTAAGVSAAAGAVNTYYLGKRKSTFYLIH